MTFVRVKLANGSEVSVSEEYADAHGLKPLKKAASRGGRALPAKHRVSTAQAAEVPEIAGSNTSASPKEESQ